MSREDEMPKKKPVSAVKKPDEKATSKRAQKEERLAEALRANLRRRKTGAGAQKNNKDG